MTKMKDKDVPAVQTQCPVTVAPGCSQEPLLVEEGYLGFNVITYAGRFYGLAQDEGAFIPQKAGTGQYHHCLEGSSLPDVEQQIDRLKRTKEVYGASIVLIAEGYKAFNIIYCGHRFYGLAQDEGAFSLARAKAGQYRRCVEGASAQEVRQQIDRMVWEGPR